MYFIAVTKGSKRGKSGYKSEFSTISTICKREFSTKKSSDY